MKYVCAQPATKYYAWQVDAMLHSFKKQNVNLQDVHIVCAIHGEVDDHFDKMSLKYPEAIFEYYEDTRKERDYISSIRPHILQKHFDKYSDLYKSHVFYHDCDIALTKPLPTEKLTRDEICYLSDTISYIGYDYIVSKGQDVLEKMLTIIAIDEETVKKNQHHSGGAQYMIKNIDKFYWRDVERDCNRLFKDITQYNNKKKEEDPNYHEIQIWSSDMWAVLWNLWKRGNQTMVIPELDFSWSTSGVEQWDKNAIFHNAGVVSENNNQFFKALYMKKFPPLNHDYEKTSCGHKYYEIVKEALTLNIVKQEVVEENIVQVWNPDNNEYVNLTTGKQNT